MKKTVYKSKIDCNRNWKPTHNVMKCTLEMNVRLLLKLVEIVHSIIVQSVYCSSPLTQCICMKIKASSNVVMLIVQQTECLLKYV